MYSRAVERALICELWVFPRTGGNYSESVLVGCFERIMYIGGEVYTSFTEVDSYCSKLICTFLL